MLHAVGEAGGEVGRAGDPEVEVAEGPAGHDLGDRVALGPVDGAPLDQGLAVAGGRRGGPGSGGVPIENRANIRILGTESIRITLKAN